MSNPTNVGRVEVYGGQTRVLTDVVASVITVYPGATVTATNVKVTGGVHVLGYLGSAPPKLHMTASQVYGGMTVHTHDASGNLYGGAPIPVDVTVDGSWIRRHRGSGDDHTNALQGFGLPQGAVFKNSTFVHEGPSNGTATATMNWHGADTVFDGNYHTWETGVAAHFTVYVNGPNNVVRNTELVRGLADYIYPNSPSPATYENITYTPTWAP